MLNIFELRVCWRAKGFPLTILDDLRESDGKTKQGERNFINPLRIHVENMVWVYFGVVMSN